jgi:hypothetical protein
MGSARVLIDELIQGSVSLEGKDEINQERPKIWLLVLNFL